jgi:spore coat protein U-like protein
MSALHRRLAAATSLFCLLLALAAPAMAGDAATVRVTATVLGICKVVGVDDISFGDLDPSQPINSQAQGAVRFMCTRGVDYRLSIDQGMHHDPGTALRRMRGAGDHFLPYALAGDGFSGTGTGFRTPIELPLMATIRGEDYQDLPASGYEDVIRVVLEP